VPLKESTIFIGASQQHPVTQLLLLRAKSPVSSEHIVLQLGLHVVEQDF